MTVAFALTGMAQEALFAGTQIESPVVNGDGSVTYLATLGLPGTQIILR